MKKLISLFRNDEFFKEKVLLSSIIILISSLILLAVIFMGPDDVVLACRLKLLSYFLYYLAIWLLPISLISNFYECYHSLMVKMLWLFFFSGIILLIGIISVLIMTGSGWEFPVFLKSIVVGWVSVPSIIVLIMVIIGSWLTIPEKVKEVSTEEDFTIA